jgi:hypothetical protein
LAAGLAADHTAVVETRGCRPDDVAFAVDDTGDAPRPPPADRTVLTRTDPRSAGSLDRPLSYEVVEDTVDAAEIRRAAGRFLARALAIDDRLGQAALRVTIRGSADRAGVDGEQQEADGKSKGNPHFKPPARASHVARRFRALD